MEAAKSELRGIEEKALDVQQKVVDAKAAVHEQAAKMEGVKAQHREVEQQLATIRSVEEDIKNSLEENERNVKENDKKAKHWDTQLAKVRRERAEAEGLSELPPLCSEEELQAVDDDRVAETITLLESELARFHLSSPHLFSCTCLAGALCLLGTWRRDLRFRACPAPRRRKHTPLTACPPVPVSVRVHQASMKPDMGAIAAWQKKEEEYCRRVEELRVVTEARVGSVLSSTPALAFFPCAVRWTRVAVLASQALLALTAPALCTAPTAHPACNRAATP